MKKKMFYSGLAFCLAITGAIATNAIAANKGKWPYYSVNQKYKYGFKGASVAAGHYLSVGVKNNGIVFVTKKLNKQDTGIRNWSDIVQVAITKNDSLPTSLLGLRRTGTVIRHPSLEENPYQGWEDIKQVGMGADHAVGLTNDGFVVATGENRKAYAGTENWVDIAQIAVGTKCTVGLDSYGQVFATGTLNGYSLDRNRKGYSLNSLSDWYNIKQVSVYDNHIVGLTDSGTVVTYGYKDRGEAMSDVDNWTDIKQVAAGYASTFGLTKGGTVLIAGLENKGLEKVKEWTDIVQIAAGGWHVVGMKSDGTMVATNNNVKVNLIAKKPQLCQLKPKSGLCLAYMPNYYYDVNTDTCKQFIYGGCLGNENRFWKLHECKAKCGNLSAL